MQTKIITRSNTLCTGAILALLILFTPLLLSAQANKGFRITADTPMTKVEALAYGFAQPEMPASQMATQTLQSCFGEKTMQLIRSSQEGLNLNVTALPASQSGNAPLYANEAGTIYGAVVYSDSWTSGNAQFGIYSFLPYISSPTPSLVKLDNSFNIRSGTSDGTYFYGIYLGTDTEGYVTSIEHRVWDVNTWSLLHSNSSSTSDLSNVPQCMTYDYTSGKIYGCFFNSDASGYIFASYDPSSLTTTKISTLSTSWNACAVDYDGTLYALTNDGKAYTVNKTTGATTFLGNCGYTPKYLSSAAIDQSSGKFYWALSASDEKGYLLEVSKYNGHASEIHQMSGNEEVVGLFVKTPQSTPTGVPAEVRYPDVNETSTLGRVVISWNAPVSQTDGGNVNSSALRYDIADTDGNTIATNLTQTSYTYQVVTSGQKNVQYAIKSYYSGSSDGSYAATKMIAVGTPYSLPFSESFDNASISYIWSAYTNDYTDVYIGDNTAFSDMNDSDGTNGFIYFSGKYVDDQASIVSGKITISGANPTLSFNYYNISSADDNDITVYVCQANNENTYSKVAQVRQGDGNAAAWNSASVNLSSYIGQTVQIKFEANIKTHTYVMLDAINIASQGTPPSSEYGTYYPVNYMAEGEYLLYANGKIALPLSSSVSYGYLPTMEVSGTAHIEVARAVAFTVTKVTGGYTIQDNLGRYYYQTGSYNSFNVSTSRQDGDVWTFVVQTDGSFIIKNVATSKVIQYNTSYGTWGVYSTVTETLPKLYKYGAEQQTSGIFLRGSINSWTASPDYEFVATSTSGVYELNNITIPAGSQFKVADADWSSINYGSNGSAIQVGVPYNMSKNGDNISANVAFSGRIQLTVSNGKYTLLLDGPVQQQQCATPTFSQTGDQVTISCATPNATIHYTIGGATPTTASKKYTGPITVSGDQLIKARAYADNYDPSEIASFTPSVVSPCANVTFSLSNNKLTMTSSTSGAIIYYTSDGSTPTTSSKRYTTPITLTQNATYKAIATKSGMSNSAVTTYTVNWFKCENPVITQSGNKVTITCATPNAKIYYTIGGATPTQSSTLYSGAFTLSNNSVVKAIAYADNFNPSDVTTFTPGMSNCATPNASYNGRYVTLSTSDGSTIYYTTDGSTPTTSSKKYTSTFDADGVAEVKAIAAASGKNSSDVVTLKINAYFDGTNLTVFTPGNAREGFGWTNMSAVESIVVKGEINNDDIATFKTMRNLHHLNMIDCYITNNTLADRAFANMLTLTSVLLPSTLTSAGTSLFVGSNRLAAVEWNSFTPMSTGSLANSSNPNLLLFVKNTSLAPSDYTGNIITNRQAHQIKLRGNDYSDFYSPYEFTVNSIEYTRNFTMPTIIGRTAGWETIVLPFDVQKITHWREGEIAPFAANRSDVKHFWLSTISGSRLAPTDRIFANKPYTISMPNNPEYSDSYILTGDVTFSATNVTIQPTKCEPWRVGDFYLVPSLSALVMNENIFSINRIEINGQPIGSMFVPNIRDAGAFEAYLTPANDQKRSHVMLSDLMDLESGIGDIPTRAEALTFYSHDGVLYIRTEAYADVMIHSSTGALVRQLQVAPGVSTVTGLAKGIYFINRKPVIVK